MRFPRSAGILLHPTSLPGRHGVGDFGPSAYRFADFLAETGIQVWQILPLGPTGYGNSPYQTISAFAGNPLLISLEILCEQDLLSEGDLQEMGELPEGPIDFEAVTRLKMPWLRRAHGEFERKSSGVARKRFADFCCRSSFWLDDFALFSALKDHRDGMAWTDWPDRLAQREEPALRSWGQRLEDEIQMRKFFQFLFFEQWGELKRYCSRFGIRILGDIPIFMAHDSAEVWSHPELFDLDEDGRPGAVAGVPPDYFSETGQLWGNPLYRWDRMAETGYSWWIERFRAALEIADLLRLDHFRGFEAYWRVPAGEETAITGEWVKGPGADFFRTVEKQLLDLPLIAENLGWITPEVEALRKEFRLPGMAILQFAFGGDPRDSDFIPHNLTRDTVFYTGTHDNDTVVGWWNSRGEGDTRSPNQISTEKDFAGKYLNTDGREIHWDFIRAVLSSIADIGIVPLQDVLGLGNEARMNLPGTSAGNWTWRFKPGMLTDEICSRLKEMVFLYGRRRPETAKEAEESH